MLTRFVALYALLRWLKPRWLRLAVLIISLILISYSHSEYMSYVGLTEDRTYLALSYLLKYALTLIALVGFVISLRFLSSKTVGIKGKQNSKIVTADPDHDDGFDFLRGKKGLDSRLDKILKK